MSKSGKKNILFILTDQLRKDFLGCYGSSFCQTPHLDQLAAEGTLFQNAYTTCPACAPARASLQTGLYPFQHGMSTNIFQHGCMIHELVDSPSLLSRRLNEYGYQAGFTGKWHLGYGKKTFEDPVYQELWKKIESHRDDIEYPDFYRSGSSLPTDLGYEGDDFPGHGGGGHAYPLYQEYLQQNGLKYEVEKAKGGEWYEVTSPMESTVDYFLTERAIHWMEEFQRGEKGEEREEKEEKEEKEKGPFAMMLNFWGPHEPYHVPTEFLDRYRGKSFAEWANFSEKDQTNKPKIHHVKRKESSWEEVEKELVYSCGYVSFIDHLVGKLVAYLKKKGLWEDTVLVFSADHGDSLHCHNGLMDKSFHCYEEIASVPLIIRDPENKREQKEERFASLVDLYSTFLDIAGVPPSLHERHGRSLMPLVKGEEVEDWPETVVMEGSGLAHCLFTQRMIRYGHYKYVFNCGSVDELYDLQADPHELHNLAVEETFQDKLIEMQEHLDKWLEAHGDGLLGQFRSIYRGERKQKSCVSKK